MLNYKNRIFLSLLALSILPSCNNQPEAKTEIGQSSLSTVAIPQTGVRDQGRLGICWAYGTTALIESELLRTKNIQADISEEALAFEHMAEALRAQFAKMTSWDLVDFMMRGQLPEGWATRTTKELASMYEDSPHVQHDALALIKIHGAVPESAWSFKIKTIQEKDQLVRAVRENIRRTLAEGLIIQKLTIEQIKDLILVGRYGTAFPSRPPSYFQWQGEFTTARDFAAGYLNFNPDAWEAIAISKEEDIPSFVQGVKETLARGHSVPLAFPINIDRISGDTFRADTPSKDYSWSSYGRDGGHLVLVTDFMNKGGTRGAVSQATLNDELNKPASELDALLFKNSWGIGAKMNEKGQPVGMSPDGYYRMEAGYILGISKIPAATRNPWAVTLAVVPREIANAHIDLTGGSR
ncbi:MAG: hypothetical protein EBR09_09100 [Proteobacteria bacterium]|nr:hypothetical protein [Pseudomonadota bacterium]